MLVCVIIDRKSSGLRSCPYRPLLLQLPSSHRPGERASPPVLSGTPTDAKRARPRYVDIIAPKVQRSLCESKQTSHRTRLHSFRSVLEPIRSAIPMTSLPADRIPPRPLRRTKASHLPLGGDRKLHLTDREPFHSMISVSQDEAVVLSAQRLNSPISPRPLRST